MTAARRLVPVCLAGVLLLATAPAASADAADPSALPVLAQTHPEVRQQGCRRASGRTTGRPPWPQTLLRPETAWPLSRGGGVTVAVVGSGVDAGSAALAGRVTLGPRLYGDGDSGRDCVGHGTFLAGLIAAGRRPGTGLVGIAPEARILAVAVTDDSGATGPELLAKGIRAAADAGARVILVAVPAGAAGDELAAAVRHARERNALVIAPAGADNGLSRDAPAYPAAYPDVLAVADLGPAGPSRGSAYNGRVDLAAPGEAVTGPGPGTEGLYTASGPSYAAAFVAGTAALVLGYRPDLTAERLAPRLKSTAYPPGTDLPHPRLGFGTVDPAAAVSALLPDDGAPGNAPAARDDLALSPAPDRTATRRAVTVAAGATATVLLVAFAAVVLPRGRRRGWRPG